MSHYCVAVFSNDSDDFSFDELLRPYSEIDKGYYQFIPAKNLNERFEKFKVQNPEKDCTLEQYAQEYLDLKKEGDVWGYYGNPDAKWDWYNLDGYDWMYEPKQGEELDDGSLRYRKSQMDFSDRPTEEEAVFWDWYVDGKPRPDGEEDWSGLFKKEYYLERYGTKEQYLKEMASSAPYAFVTPDGQWHSPGTVGWFACSNDTAESYNAYMEEWKSFLEQEDDPYVSFVDCHI